MKTDNDRIQEYRDGFRALADDFDHQIISECMQVFRKTRQQKAMIYMAGNGGSAATSSHFAADLAKNTRSDTQPGFRTYSLPDNIPMITSLANDEAYESIFVEQLKSLFLPGDVLFAISTSGNSMNIVKAAEYIHNRGGTVISLTGPGGGKLEQFSNHLIECKSGVIEQIENHHLAIIQLFVYLFKHNA